VVQSVALALPHVQPCTPLVVKETQQVYAPAQLLAPPPAPGEQAQPSVVSTQVHPPPEPPVPPPPDVPPLPPVPVVV